ncbi:ferritin [bacterium]|nr:ferritin [bacterium]
MLSKKIQKAFNEQMTFELYSGYIYMSMAAWFRTQNLDGFAAWMENHAREEVTHGMKFYTYLYDRLSSAEFGAIAKPKTTWKSPIEAVKQAFDHEQEVTRRIHELVELAENEKDHASVSFLQWFVDEQVEEEQVVDEIYSRMQLVGDFKPGLFFLDRELASSGASQA